MSNHKQFLCKCTTCGGTTSRTFARNNAGKCKSCVTGSGSQLKPGQYWEDDGGEYKMSPEYAHEVRGGNDLSPD